MLPGHRWVGQWQGLNLISLANLFQTNSWQISNGLGIDTVLSSTKWSKSVTSGSNCDWRRMCCQASKICFTQHRIQHNATSTDQNGQGSNDPEPYIAIRKARFINLLWKKLWEYWIFHPWISIKSRNNRATDESKTLEPKSRWPSSSTGMLSE